MPQVYIVVTNLGKDTQESECFDDYDAAEYHAQKLTEDGEDTAHVFKEVSRLYAHGRNDLRGRNDSIEWKYGT